MGDVRWRFHDQLDDVEEDVLEMSMAARELFGQSLQALRDPSLSSAVIALDDRVDAYYAGIERQVLELFALEAPVACDLRLLTALLHVDLHLERVADMGVNIAKIAGVTRGLPRKETVLSHLEEMGDIAIRLLDASMDAFARRDLELARRLNLMDEPLDRLNRAMLAEVMAVGDEAMLLRWAVEMHLASRLIERVGDHAVDIGEQAAFLVSGVFEEFTDASHAGAANAAG